MGRKKKKVIKPWCWYCNREFEDEKTLMQHQKAKHFKCHVCHKKLYTGPGLAIHCMQVHKETIEKIPNALPTRDSTEIEIYGMEGVPEEDILAWASRKGDPDEPDAKQARLAADMLKAQAAMMPGMIPPPGMPPAGWVPPPMPGYPGMPMPPNMPMPPGPGGYGMPPMMPMGMPPMSGAPPMPMMGGPPSMGMNGMGGPPGMPPVSAPLAPTVGGGPGSVVATFPAYNAKTSSPAMGTENMAATPGSTKIMHPDEDISLEERRAQMPQYQLTKTPIADTLSLLPDGGSGIHSGAVFANVMLGAGGGGYNKGPPIPPYALSSPSAPLYSQEVSPQGPRIHSESPAACASPLLEESQYHYPHHTHPHLRVHNPAPNQA